MADGGIGELPFFALERIRPLMLVSEAVLPVTTAIEMMDGEDQTIPGLFAAGSVIQGGLSLPEHGQHLAWSFTSGRMSGRNAARAYT